jgi:hypothetical protein
MTRRPISTASHCIRFAPAPRITLPLHIFFRSDVLGLQMRGYAFARRWAAPGSIRFGLGFSKPIETAAPEPHFMNASALKSRTQANAIRQFAGDSLRSSTARGARGACFLYCEILGGVDI